MKGLKGLATYLYKHHLIRYLFVGGTTFIIDEGLLILLHGKVRVNLELSLLVAYSVAFVYNFSLNRWWAFSASENKSLGQHIAPYSLLFFFNLGFNIIFVSLMSHVINYALAKPLAVIIQITWTYIIYRNYIFTTSTQKSTNADKTAAIS
jgi:putative flippase GtrA